MTLSTKRASREVGPRFAGAAAAVSTESSVGEVHPLVTGLPATITTPEEALPLAALVDEQVPPELREDSSYHLSLSVWLKRAEFARLNGDHQNLRVFEGQVVHMYPFALHALGRFLAERDGGIAPALVQTQETLAQSVPRSPDTTAAAPAPVVSLATATSAVITPAAAEEMNRAVLNIAPSIVQLAQVSTGMAAVIFAYVRRVKLYKQAGFKSMGAYAETQLGLKGETYWKYAGAGRAAWEHYEALAWEVIRYVYGAARGEHPLVPGGSGLAVAPPGGIRIPPAALPSLPAVSVLKELPRALRRTDPSEHPDIIAGVAAGTFTYEELRQKGKVATNVQPAAPVSDEVAEDDTDDVGEPEVAEGQGRPDIFNDIPDLEDALRCSRRSSELLETLLRVWGENDGGHDVDPILPRVRVLAAKQKSIATELEDHIIPRTICASCSGEGCRACRRMGWLPRVPLRTGPKKAAPRPRAKTVRRVPRHKKNETRREK